MGEQYDEGVDRPWVFVGAILTEVAVVTALWALGWYFGS